MEKQDYVDSKIKYKKPEIDNKNKKEKKLRKCMNYEVCENEFWSEGNHNRLCNVCGKVRSKASYSVGY